MQVRRNARLAELTTLGVGGPIDRLVEVTDADELVAAVRARRFGWIVLNAELYPEPVLAAIGQSYYLYEEYEINGTRQRLFAPGDE